MGLLFYILNHFAPAAPKLQPVIRRRPTPVYVLPAKKPAKELVGHVGSTIKSFSE